MLVPPQNACICILFITCPLAPQLHIKACTVSVFSQLFDCFCVGWINTKTNIPHTLHFELHFHLPNLTDILLFLSKVFTQESFTHAFDLQKFLDSKNNVPVLSCKPNLLFRLLRYDSTALDRCLRKYLSSRKISEFLIYLHTKFYDKKSNLYIVWKKVIETSFVLQIQRMDIVANVSTMLFLLYHCSL